VLAVTPLEAVYVLGLPPRDVRLACASCRRLRERGFVIAFTKATSAGFICEFCLKAHR